MKEKHLEGLTRFSSRAKQYKNRAPYPPELYSYIRTTCDLTPVKVIADIGSGTGYLTRVLLQGGGRVYGVEPNPEMRAVAEETLGQNPAFVSLNGRAEAIPLAEHTVDIVTVGQALHWFEVEQARTEFLRILRSGGWIVVVDMFTRDEETDFMRTCAMVRQANFADIGKAADPPLRVVRLFEGLKPVKKVIPHIFLCNEQVFRDGFLSSSLAPEFGTKAYQRVAENIREIFDTYQIDGLVRLEFETIVWSAHVDFC